MLAETYGRAGRPTEGLARLDEAVALVAGCLAQEVTDFVGPALASAGDGSAKMKIAGLEVVHPKHLDVVIGVDVNDAVGSGNLDLEIGKGVIAASAARAMWSWAWACPFIGANTKVSWSRMTVESLNDTERTVAMAAASVVDGATVVASTGGRTVEFRDGTVIPAVGQGSGSRKGKASSG
jgi:hypothetical protein